MFLDNLEMNVLNTREEIILLNIKTQKNSEGSLDIENDNGLKEEPSWENSSSDESESFQEADDDQATESNNEEDTNNEYRRSQRPNRGVPPDRYTASSYIVLDVKNEPLTVKEALSGPNKDNWKKAMDEEINSLKENGTWDVVPRPENQHVVTCKWIFKQKQNASGSTQKYKARLVARGFCQKYGTDYDEVFAPVVRQTTFRTFLSLAGQKGMIVKHFDAKTAFLNGKLTETIYMEQPDEYVIQGKENYVCKLKRSIYGLKQAAKVWNDQLNNLLKQCGFIQSQADSCLYVKNNEREKMYLIVYVDDILIASRKNVMIDQVFNFLKGHFTLSDLGPLKYYLGMEIRKNDNGFYCIKQEEYIKKILCKFGLQDAKVSSVPLNQDYVKCRNNGSPMPENAKYQQLIGALLYLAVNSRPDISASVAMLSQYNKQPTTVDWIEAKESSVT